MEKKTVTNSLNALGELAKRIGRSGSPGHQLSPIVAKRLELDMNLHIEILRRYLGKAVGIATSAKAT